MATKKVVLITGGNNGIGYEIVKALLQSTKQTYDVLMGSRSLDKANKAIDNLKQEVPKTESTVEAVQVDVTSDKSIEAAFEQVKAKHDHIDALVNNAGANYDIDFLRGKISLRESFTTTYDTNVSGAHVMSWTFAPLLLKSSEPRLIFTAGLANITHAADPNRKYYPTPSFPAGWPKEIQFEVIGYRCSKVALNMLAFDWRHKLQNDGVKVFSVGPGMVLTDLGGMREQAKDMPGIGDPAVSGRTFRSVIEGERDADAGRLISKDGVMDL